MHMSRSNVHVNCSDQMSTYCVQSDLLFGLQLHSQQNCLFSKQLHKTMYLRHRPNAV